MATEYVLIDSPVGYYSSVDDIEAWIRELNKMTPGPQVNDEIAKAQELLAEAKSLNLSKTHGN